jgi:hypothetical protein
MPGEKGIIWPAEREANERGNAATGNGISQGKAISNAISISSRLACHECMTLRYNFGLTPFFFVRIPHSFLCKFYLLHSILF